jgi:hypothetical protein
MGQEFYLVREDNRTLFELGKFTGAWREWLGRGNAIVVVDGFEETLAGLLAGDLVSWMGTQVDADAYAALIAHRIVTWAGGQPFRFASEQDCERERWGEDGDPWPVTGTRYSG